jgi:hypothetical protein
LKLFFIYLRIRDSELFEYDHINDLSSIELTLYDLKLVKDTTCMDTKAIQECLKDITDEISNLKRSKSKEDRESFEKYVRFY